MRSLEKFRNELSGARVLVTGGAGFIGSNLCEVLLGVGCEVRCLDNFATGFHRNVDGFLSLPGFSLLEGDIRDEMVCRQAVRGVDFVLHQAALGSVPRSVKDPATSVDVNVGGFVKILFAAKEARVKRFVYAASSSTYGDHAGLPKVEERIGKPLSPYAITKYADELFAENFSRIYGIETVGLRYFNVFGRRQDPNGAYAAVIPRFVMALMSGVSPVINGDGSYSRDFTYVDNVIQANLLALTGGSATIYPDPACTHEVFNVAFGERTDLIQLVDYLKAILSEQDPEIASVQPVFGPQREGDIPHSLASIEKARRLLGYEPEFSVREGLEEAVEWYWQNLRGKG